MCKWNESDEGRKFGSMVEWIDNWDKRGRYVVGFVCALTNICCNCVWSEEEKSGAESVSERGKERLLARHLFVLRMTAGISSESGFCVSGEGNVTGICDNCGEKSWTVGMVGVWIVEIWNWMHQLLRVVEWVERKFGLWCRRGKFVVDDGDLGSYQHSSCWLSVTKVWEVEFYNRSVTIAGCASEIRNGNGSCW